LNPRQCPICERQPLGPTTVQGVEIETCARCGGLWFESGKLERFPDRPSARALLPLAEHAPGRCRRAGHPISLALVRCAVCGSAPAQCPSCNLRLAMVPTAACAIDICVRCKGVWLDAGEFESLRAMARAAPAAKQPSPRTSGAWEIPEPASPAKDRWLGPGQVQAPQRVSEIPNVRAPFSCRQCGASLGVAHAWAYDGEIYCEQCHPPGAVSSRDLPSDSDGAPIDEPNRSAFGHRLLRLMINLVSRGD
jgi:Zn-finger nucleic acid-binding protein